jgi:hypothetical protein
VEKINEIKYLYFGIHVADNMFQDRRIKDPDISYEEVEK